MNCQNCNHEIDLHEHDAELWKLLIDGKPRAICKACGYPELIGSDDCRNCGKEFNERIEFGEKHDAEMRKPLVDALKLTGEALQCADYALTHRESDQQFTLSAVRDAMARADDALAKVKE